MNCTRGITGVFILSFVTLLPACKDKRVDDILTVQAEQQAIFADHVAQLETRLVGSVGDAASRNAHTLFDDEFRGERSGLEPARAP